MPPPPCSSPPPETQRAPTFFSKREGRVSPEASTYAPKPPFSIGANVRAVETSPGRDTLVVISLVPDGACDRAGVSPGDQLIEVEGSEVLSPPLAMPFVSPTQVDRQPKGEGSKFARIRLCESPP